MGLPKDELERSLRVALAALYEHCPRKAGLFMAFGPYSPGEATRFVITVTGEQKLDAAHLQFGMDNFDCLIAAGNSRALMAQYGTPAAVALHFYLVDEPPFEYVIGRALEKIEEEVPQHQDVPNDIADLDLMTEIIKAPES